MSFTRAADSLRPSIVRLRLSLETALAECQRAHGPSAPERIPAPRRRVPTGQAGRAGADILGQILGWNPSSLKGGATGE